MSWARCTLQGFSPDWPRPGSKRHSSSAVTSDVSAKSQYTLQTRRPRELPFAQPRLKIRPRPASLRMNEHDETEEAYRGDNARSCADQRYRSDLDCRRFAEEHQLLRGARLRDRRAVGRERDAVRRDAAIGQDPDRLEPGRLEEGALPQQGNRRALVHL